MLYTQRRIGAGGRSIGVVKFRTMQWKYSTGPDREYKTAEEAFAAMGRSDLIPEFQLTQKVADDPGFLDSGRSCAERAWTKCRNCSTPSPVA